MSYGRDVENPQDIDLVRRVKVDLEKEGFEVLMDEEQLRTTDDWEMKLEEMIRASDWMLFFITPYSARRPEGYCLNELAFSLSLKKPIAPVMVNYIVPPLSICRVQYLDLQAVKSDDDYEKKFKEITSIISGEKELGFEGWHLKVLTDLSPIKFDTVIAKHIYGFTGRGWIYDEVERWLSQEDNSRVLWITAEAGFGKSAIATYLARSHPSAVSIHFCQYDYLESRDPREMLKVLIYELGTQIEEYDEILQTKNVKEVLQGSAEHIFSQLLLEPLESINPDKKLFFIIDALDEAVDNGKNRIVELISNRFTELPSWLNIVITSRSEPELYSKLKKFNPMKLRANDERNLKDLKEYLSKNQNIQDQTIIDALSQKSEGNILYLKSIFELEMIKQGELTVENIQELPVSMDGFYLTYFERKFEETDLYEEKYLKFVSLLVSEEGLPELLIRDILKLGERDYKKIKSNFGSLLEVDGQNLTFYHKSIYEWLSDYDKSGDYSADMLLGREILEEFMDSITAESYKEEYLEFESFNRGLLDRFYEQDKSLEKFFEVLQSVESEKKVDILHKLGKHYYLHNRIYRAIELQEEVLTVTKELYQNNPERWAMDYTRALNNLALSYKDSNRILEAIELEKESLTILKELYQTNPERWAWGYTRSLNNLALSYYSNNRIHEAIKLQEHNLTIQKELYQTNPERWAKYYTGVLINLANSYYNGNRVPEAIELDEQSLTILKELYQTNPERWAEYYTGALDNLGDSYYNSNRVPEAIELQEESLTILEELYQTNPERWVEYYTAALNNLAISYGNSNRIPEAIELEEHSSTTLKELYQTNPERWAKGYTTALNNLAFSYGNSNRTPEAIELEEQSLTIRKELYQNNPERWAEYYTTALGNLARSYYNSNRIPEAIELGEESLSILEKLFQNNHERWEQSYTRAFNNLKIMKQ